MISKRYIIKEINYVIDSPVLFFLRLKNTSASAQRITERCQIGLDRNKIIETRIFSSPQFRVPLGQRTQWKEPNGKNPMERTQWKVLLSMATATVRPIDKASFLLPPSSCFFTHPQGPQFDQALQHIHLHLHNNFLQYHTPPETSII